MSIYNPFAMIHGTLNNEMIYLRPVAFDSSDYDKNYKKPDGSYIRPIMAQTTCPKCSCVIEQSIPIVFDFDKSLIVNCIKCNPPLSVSNVFPFEDPISNLKLNIAQINPEAIVNLQVISVGRPTVKAEKPEEPGPLDKLFRPTKPMGLGDFIRGKEAWNKLKRQIDDGLSKTKDIFDTFSNMSEPKLSDTTDLPL